MSLAEAVTSIVEDMEKDVANSLKTNGSGDPIEDACVGVLQSVIKNLRLALKAAEGQTTVPARNDADFHRQQIERAKLDLRTKKMGSPLEEGSQSPALGITEQGKVLVARGQLAEAMDNIAIIKGGRLDGDSVNVPPGTIDGDCHFLGGQEYEYRAGAYHYKGDVK